MSDSSRQSDRSTIARSEVERIVREVISRFAARQPSSNGAAAPLPSAGRLLVQERVVTVATLANRLQGINEIALARGAVVTPAARDLLRENNIHVSHSTAPNPAWQGARQLVLAVAATAYEPAALSAALARRSIRIEQIARVGLTGVIDSLIERIALGGERALLLTGEPEVAVCLANRRRGVRAVACGCHSSAKRALRKVAANLLVIDPRGKSSHELSQIAEELSANQLHCPAEYASQLG